MLLLTEDGRELVKNMIEPLFQYEEEASGMITDQKMDAAIETQNRFADILLGKMEKEWKHK